MKIDDSLTAPASVRRQKARNAKSKSSATSSNVGGAQDSVDITQMSATLNLLEGKLSLMDVSDPNKTEAVRQAVAEGHFQVNEGAVADALVQHSMQQLQTPKKK